MFKKLLILSKICKRFLFGILDVSTSTNKNWQALLKFMYNHSFVNWCQFIFIL